MPDAPIDRLTLRRQLDGPTHGAAPAPASGTVRAAGPADLVAIAGFDEFNGDRAAEIAAATCLVALDEAGRVAGYASWAARGLLGQPFLAYLCVRPDARRQGHATALLQAARQRVSGRWLLSSTEDWCAPMQTLFERLGWQRCGVLEGINRDGSQEWFYRVAIGWPGAT